MPGSKLREVCLIGFSAFLPALFSPRQPEPLSLAVVATSRRGHRGGSEPPCRLCHAMPSKALHQCRATHQVLEEPIRNSGDEGSSCRVSQRAPLLSLGYSSR